MVRLISNHACGVWIYRQKIAYSSTYFLTPTYPAIVAVRPGPAGAYAPAGKGYGK